jgi:RNA polymerase sigma factor (sigma-70 family)
MNRTELEAQIATQRPRLLKVAENLVGREDAADVVQYTLANVFAGKKWREMDAEHLAKYLTLQIEGDCLNHLEARNRHLDHLAEYIERSPARVIDEDDLVRKVDVERALAKLPDEIRAAVIDVVIDGATVREHGAAAGVSHETASKRAQRGIEMLRGLLTNTPSARVQIRKGQREEGTR